jgi:hypothetical protein
VGGRLAHYWENWIAIGADQWVVRILKEGYRVEFTDVPPLSNIPLIDSTPQNVEKRVAMGEMLEKFIAKNILEVVRNLHSPGFYSRFFLVPQKEKGVWRGILDLSVLNNYVLKEHFKMETAEDVRVQLSPGEWATSLDLKDAYYHIPIHRASRKFLRFVYQGKVYQFQALPMGLATSPRTFTRVIHCLKEFLQRFSVVIHQYLDDWLTHAASRETVNSYTQAIVHLAQSVGFVINREKSELVPTQDCVYLGYRFRLAQGLLCPTEERWQKIQEKILPFLKQPVCRAQQWQSMIGVLSATEKLVHLGMLHLRPIQVAMLQNWSPFRGNPDELLPIQTEVILALRWWTVKQNVMTGVPLSTGQPQHHVFTDASLQGWGGHWNQNTVQGIWTETEAAMHINVLELLAVWRVLKAFVSNLKNTVVMVASDNTTTVAYIRKQGGTRSPDLLNLTSQLYTWLEENQITLKCRHIAGRLNVLADGLSREGQILPTEWGLHPRALNYLWARWEKPLIDMFATRHNRKLPMFVSPVPDQEALAIDALSIDWSGMHFYAFPPTAIITQVLLKIQQHDCKVVLIAPAWPKQKWYTLLLGLLVDHPLNLPEWPHLLKQPQSDVYHPTPGVFRLHAWKLSSRLEEIEAFQNTLQIEWVEHRKSPVWQSTRESGNFFVIGVRRGKSILSTIEGYRTAIGHTIKATQGIDIGKDQDLADLLANFSRERVRHHSTIPCWNLSLVLLILTKPPFEPLHQAELKYATWKTVFLLAWLQANAEVSYTHYAVTFYIHRIGVLSHYYQILSFCLRHSWQAKGRLYSM